MKIEELEEKIGNCVEAMWKLQDSVDKLRRIVMMLNEYNHKINRCSMCEKPLDDEFLLEDEPLCKCWNEEQ